MESPNLRHNKVYDEVRVLIHALNNGKFELFVTDRRSGESCGVDELDADQLREIGNACLRIAGTK